MMAKNNKTTCKTRVYKFLITKQRTGMNSILRLAKTHKPSGSKYLR